MNGGGPSLPSVLPPLRDDLRLHRAAASGDGSPAWVIQDPVSNVFYRIGWLEFELLVRWELASPAAILASVHGETLLDPSREELGQLYSFLLANQLFAIHHADYTRYLLARRRALHPSRLKWLLHHYLFFRLPLVRPERFLERLLPMVRWLTRPWALALLAALSLLGVLLTLRQWDVFVAGFTTGFTPAALVGFLLALTLTKSVHELGHALTATRYGVRVGHMGVAFLVLWPFLYTDTGEAWRLADRRQRLTIVAAGLLCELAVAGLATLAWHLTGNQDARQVFFYLATTAWVLSLLVNASPFMRFDGYFLLSDLLDLPNLHERSFALARTWLRNTLLGWDEPYPESFPPIRRRGLIAFALGTWLYRLVVFVGIAVAVYYLFFKVLGVLLFAVEIAWFVLRPVRNELKVWIERRQEIVPNRRHLALCCAVLLLSAALVPWRQNIGAPAWAHPARTYTFYSPLPGQLLAPPPAAGEVAAGAVLFTLQQPEIQHESTVALTLAAAVQKEMDSLLGLEDGEERRLGLQRLRAMHQARAQGNAQEADRLQLTAPFTGTLLDVNRELAMGSWVASQTPLATLVDTTRWVAEAFIRQEDVERLPPGASVRFYPENQALAPLTGRVESVDATRTLQLPHPMLSVRYGGPVAVVARETSLAPRDTLYRVRVVLDGPPRQQQLLRGTAVIRGTARSWLGEMFKPVLTLIIRELTF